MQSGLEIQTNFDSNSPPDVRGEFIDISKAFDKVRHTGLLFKLKSYCVQGELLSLLEREVNRRTPTQKRDLNKTALQLY